MSLDNESVEKIARLARLSVSKDELPEYAKQLNNILDFVEQLSAVDVESVVPMAHPMDQAQRLRVDEVTESDQREKFQAIAPETEAGLYLVPKVIE